MTYHGTDSDDDGTLEADIELPSGYTFTEDANNDLIITDDNSNIVLRWDETNTQWNLEANDLTNIASASASNMSVSNAPSASSDVARKNETDANASDITTLQNQLSGYDIQKNGTDESGIINFKT